MSETVAPETAPASSGRPLARAGRYAAYVFWLMFIINFLNYLDRWIFTGLSPVIQRDLHIDDFKLGVLNSAFLLIYTIVAMPLGFLADRRSRKGIVGLGVGIWSIATALTGLVSSFGALLGVRALLGIGEGSYYPAGTPMLAAQYPPSRRATILSRWAVGALIGAAVGFLIAGFFSGDNWRHAFFFTGIPGLIFAVLIWRTREKIRHEEDPPADHLPGEGRSFWGRLRSYLSIPTFRVIVGTHAFGFFALTAVTSFSTVYLADTYGIVSGNYPHAGLPKGLVPILAGGIVLLGGICGNLGGGIIANRLSKRHTGARVMTGGLGFLLAAPSIALAVGAPYILHQIPAYTSASEGTQVAVGVAIFAIFGLLGAFFLNLYNGPMSAALLDVVPANERGGAGGTELMLGHLLGDVYAAALVGAISTALTNQLGGPQIGLALLLTCPAVLLLGGILGMWGSRFYAPDVAAVGSTAEAMLGTKVGERGRLG